MTRTVTNAETGNNSIPKPAASAAAPFLTVAICTRNRADFLEKAVHSVLPQITDDTEMLIVDNASADNTPEVASRLAGANPAVALWRENELGLSAARNAALVRARGQYVIFLDDDALAEPGWLEAYRRFLISPSAERIAVVGGAVFPDYEVAPPKWLGAGAHQLDLGGTPKRVSARGGPWGGNSAYRRVAALQVGMFDTRLGRKGNSLAALEESDLNLRLLKAGYEIWWLPGAGIRHFVAASRLGQALRFQRGPLHRHHATGLLEWPGAPRAVSFGTPAGRAVSDCNLSFGRSGDAAGTVPARDSQLSAPGESDCRVCLGLAGRLISAGLSSPSGRVCPSKEP